MYNIQANQSGTRHIKVSVNHLETIKRYSLLNIDKDLMDVCLDVIYNTNMKAFGLHELVLLYIKWLEENN